MTWTIAAFAQPCAENAPRTVEKPYRQCNKHQKTQLPPASLRAESIISPHAGASWGRPKLPYLDIYRSLPGVRGERCEIDGLMAVYRIRALSPKGSVARQ